MDVSSIDADRCLVHLDGLDDCRKLAEFIATTITAPKTIALVGTLGAGKTQWTRFFAMKLGAHPEEISSPTVYHLDAYRVGDEDEFLELGVEELFSEPSISVVEWADRFPGCMPTDCLWLHFEVHPTDPNRRTVRIENLKANRAIAIAIQGGLV
jgi:tRNA threonylcarbamoyladenosine biosynthesis protein TsaE